MFLRATKRFKDGKVHDYWSMVLFPEDRAPETDDGQVVRIRMDRLTVRNVRNWGEAWLGLELCDKLGLDGFWREVSDTLRQFHLARRATSSSSISRARTSRSMARRPSRAISSATATAATSGATVYRSWSRSSSRLDRSSASSAR